MCTLNDLLDELTYRSYAANRRASPDVTPEGWGVLFPRYRLYEARLRLETTAGVDVHEPLVLVLSS